jgi:hypothetical protein
MRDSNTQRNVIATRLRRGGLAGGEERLTVYADGTLHLLETRLQREEKRIILPGQLEPLRTALATKEWQGIGASYGTSVFDGFEIQISGGGRQTVLRVPVTSPVSLPPILDQVLKLLHQLWPVSSSDYEIET